MGKVWGQFLLILWKNYIIVKRYWIAYLMKALFPLPFFMLLTFDMRPWQFEEIKENHVVVQPAYESYDFHRITYYAPKTRFTAKLLEKLDESTTIGFDTIKKLESNVTINNNEGDSILILFYGNYQEKLPDKLDYKIVIKKTQYDKKYRKLEDYDRSNTLNKEDHHMKNIYFEDFGIENIVLKLQSVIEERFLEYVTKAPLSLKFIYQQFPFPAIKKRLNEFTYTLLISFLEVFSFVLIYSCIINDTVEEKSSGIKDLMKMMGMKSWVLWMGWLLRYLTISILTTMVVVYYMKFPVFELDTPIVRYCRFDVYIVLHLLYYSAGITFAFAVGSLFQRSTYAILFGIGLWIMPFWLIVIYDDMQLWQQMVISLFPTAAINYAYKEIFIYEFSEHRITLMEIFTFNADVGSSMSMSHVMFMLSFDTVFYFLTALYLENIFPGPYGFAKPINYPAMYIYNSILKKRNLNETPVETEVTIPAFSKIEKTENHTPCIQIRNLVKQYGTLKVIDGLSMDIYDKQIMALLGHNGAGKTTTMSIITGMASATSGHIFIYGKDICVEKNEIYGLLGLCPQHDLNFAEMTVEEHLILFGMIKGLSFYEAENSLTEILQKMNLLSRKDYVPSQLSGGMKRRLSLGMALIGNSSILILDEPTSGLDAQTRREIWDILLALRGDRTIIITTHFMEEADVLGDRIAIMDHGRLVCYGTSMFLKKQYGTGYNLVLVRSEISQDNTTKLSNIINKHVKNAEFKDYGSRITFILPYESKGNFGSLLSELEEKKVEYKVTNISISITTLEDVFLRVGDLMSQDTAASISFNDSSKYIKIYVHALQFLDHLYLANEPMTFKDRTHNHCIVRFIKQILGLIKKRLYAIRATWRTHFTHFAVCFVLSLCTIVFSDPEYYQEKLQETIPFDLTLYGRTIVFAQAPPANNLYQKLLKKYQQIVESKGSKLVVVKNLSAAVLEKGEQNIVNYQKHIVVGCEFNNSSAIAAYNYYANYGRYISYNLLTNAALKALTDNDKYSIKVVLETRINKETINRTPEPFFCILWAICFGFNLLYMISLFIFIPNIETISDVKHLQLMCHLRSFQYWLTNYVFDLVVFSIFMVIVVLQIKAFGHPLIAGEIQIKALCVIMFSFAVSAIPFAYLYSYLHKSAQAKFVITSLIINLPVSGIYVYIEPVLENAVYYTNYLVMFPPFAIIFVISNFAYRIAGNYNLHNVQNTPNGFNVYCQHAMFHPCCRSDSNYTQSYGTCEEMRAVLSYDDVVIGKRLRTMIYVAPIYLLVLFLLESLLLPQIFDFLNILLEPLAEPIWGSNRVAPVQDSIEATSVSGDEQQSTAAIGTFEVKKLTKMYRFKAVVNKMEFTVRPANYFGLLGVNGAGKTTAFRMLTGRIPTTRGNAKMYVNSAGKFVTLRWNLFRYLDLVGYCPQYNAINEYLTGREMLIVFAHLKGMSNKDVEEEVDKLISKLGFEEYKNRPCGTYSGGNKRKLCVALALIGNPLLVMLDEPTSGVDPVSKRKLWDVLQGIQRGSKVPSLILPSHSMEECEALCDRVAIMKSGRIVASGSVPYLKEKFCQGYSVKLKLNETTENVGAKSPVVVKLQEDFNAMYKHNYVLRDEHFGFLDYHITDSSKKLGVLFKEIEDLKQKNAIVDDYQINETSLEEIFLHIAKTK